jgi:hypothetical protein
MEPVNNNNNNNLNNIKKTDNNNKIPYYLLSLEEQADQYISSEEGQDIVTSFKEKIKRGIKKDN